MAQSILLVIMLVLANLPCVSERAFFFYIHKEQPKNMAWCLIELLVYYGAFLIIARITENVLFGSSVQQGWEFYSITLSLFLVLSFPAFIYKALWK